MSKYPDFISDEIDSALSDFPEIPTRTLAKRIYNDHKKFFKDIEQVRSAIRRRRGNGGKQTRGGRHERPNQKAGWKPKIPPSQAKDWVPHVIKGPERIAVISDVHIPYHSEKALKKWYADASEYEPSTILLNGDTLDFYRLSRFEKDPRMRDTAYEIDAVHEFLDWLAANFEADIIWKDGNHDERWAKYLFNHAPEFSRFEKFELQSILELKERGITYVTDKRVVMAGSLPVLHGHEMQGSSAVSPARAMAAKLGNSGVQSHCHRSSQYFERNIFGDWMKCFSTGCLCELNPDFARVNKWNHGYAFIDVYEDGSFEMKNVVLD